MHRGALYPRLFDASRVEAAFEVYDSPDRDEEGVEA